MAVGYGPTSDSPSRLMRARIQTLQLFWRTRPHNYRYRLGRLRPHFYCCSSCAPTPNFETHDPSFPARPRARNREHVTSNGKREWTPSPAYPQCSWDSVPHRVRPPVAASGGRNKISATHRVSCIMTGPDRLHAPAAGLDAHRCCTCFYDGHAAKFLSRHTAHTRTQTCTQANPT